jgi:hypothetical protein
MKIEVFALCDAATDSMGKLNILGTFDTIYAHQMPAVHPQCAVAMRVRVTRIEKGEHRIKINIVDQDGKAVVPSLDTSMQVLFPDEQPSHAFNIILNMQGLKFEKHGEYSIDLAIDGRQEASLPLFVKDPPQNPAAPPELPSGPEQP